MFRTCDACQAGCAADPSSEIVPAPIRSLIVSFIPVFAGIVVVGGSVRGALLLDDPLQGGTVGHALGRGVCGGRVAGDGEDGLDLLARAHGVATARRNSTCAG